ncbi:hypothetical protein ACFX2A_025746 [Malus domestica]
MKIVVFAVEADQEAAPLYATNCPFEICSYVPPLDFYFYFSKLSKSSYTLDAAAAAPEDLATRPRRL